ncbi:MAG: hypothetical protein JOY69_01995, partial [Candidatus Eremiobacteraeota bacterium]|nr:hypothetical protein [Candidatus Eremiobacteraeota bacterium]
GIATDDASRTRATRVLVVVVALLALGFWLEEQRTIVELLLIYYNGITQFMPATVATFVWPRVTLWGVVAGIMAGLGLVIAFALTNVSLWGVNTGFAALIVNATVLVAISLLTPRRA